MGAEARHIPADQRQPPVEVSWFSGITIEMCFDAHDPPHFHANCDDRQAVIGLEGTVLQGSLSPRCLEDVREWVSLRETQLREAWDRGQRGEHPGPIPSLDEDNELVGPGGFQPKPIEVKALPNYCIWISYADGPSGEIDLSHLAGKGVFKAWDDPEFFKAVYIEPDFGAIAWSDEIDLCPDALYLELTGMSVEELFPSLRGQSVDA